MKETNQTKDIVTNIQVDIYRLHGISLTEETQVYQSINVRGTVNGKDVSFFDLVETPFSQKPPDRNFKQELIQFGQLQEKFDNLPNKLKPRLSLIQTYSDVRALFETTNSLGMDWSQFALIFYNQADKIIFNQAYNNEPINHEGVNLKKS